MTPLHQTKLLRVYKTKSEVGVFRGSLGRGESSEHSRTWKKRKKIEERVSTEGGRPSHMAADKSPGEKGG